MNTVQIANYPPISVDELRAAGIQWHPQRGLGQMPNWMPVTQEDRDRLGVVRNEKLKRLRVLAIAAIVLSLLSIGVGLGAISSSSPDFEWPHSMGGGCVIGVVVLLYSFLILAMVREGKKTPTGDTTSNRFRCLTTCNTVYTTLCASSAMVAIAMSGIWATVDCAKRTPADDTARFSFNSCTPNTGAMYAFAVLTLLVCSVLFIIFLTMNCIVCRNYRAFGVKSNYEMFADYQMLRMQQMNLQTQQLQQQQQQSLQRQQPQYFPQGQFPIQGQFPVQGQFPIQGQFPVQGHPYQQPAYQPSAPMLPQGQPEPSQEYQDDLPSYKDVMESEKYRPTQV